MFIKPCETNYELATTLRAVRTIEKRTGKSIQSIASDIQRMKVDELIAFLSDGVEPQLKQTFMNEVEDNLSVMQLYRYASDYAYAVMTSGMTDEELGELEEKNAQALAEMKLNT